MIFMAEAENQPLYIQLRDMIKGQIESGILKPGDKVPSETALQKSFNVSRVTVRKAIEELVRNNYLIKLQGKGTYVSQVQELHRKKVCQALRSFADFKAKRQLQRFFGLR